MGEKIKKGIKQINIKNIYLILGILTLIIIFLLQFFDINSIIIGLILLWLVYILSKKNIVHFPIVLFLIAIILRLGAISIFNTLPVSDYSVILETAKNLVNHVNSINGSSYFYSWAYQTGPVLYTYVILKIFGSSIWALKVFNALFSSLNCVLIYLISKKFAKERSARLVSLLYTIFPFAILYNTVLSNQIPASTFFYLALYIILSDKEKITKYIYCALLLSLGNFLRTEGIVYVCAIIGLYLICLLSKKTNKKMHLGILTMVILYFSLNFLFDFTIKATGLNHEGLANNYPSWKFILGLNTNTCGTYNNGDIIYLESEEIGKNEVKKRITNLTFSQVRDLISCKAKITWRGESLDWTFNSLDKNEYHFLGKTISASKIRLVLTDLNQIIYYFTFGLMIIGLISYFLNCQNNKENINYKMFLFLNILAINFLVYSLIEVQNRYIYILEISIFILASLGGEFLNKNSQIN